MVGMRRRARNWVIFGASGLPGFLPKGSLDRDEPSTMGRTLRFMFSIPSETETLRGVSSIRDN